jgi:nicotinamidase-related amidase
MSLDLARLVDPGHTAVVVFEMQRGVVGDLHRMPEMGAEAARTGVIATTAALVRAARAAKIRVIHSIVEWRPDRAGTIVSSPLLAFMTKYDDHVLAGTPTAQIVPELGPAPDDFVSSRASGVSPFTATNLDHLLRSERATTVVGAGAGLTMGILGLTIEAVGLGYSVVVPADAVVDADPEYAALVWAKTLRLLATRTTVPALCDAWTSSDQNAGQTL